MDPGRVLTFRAVARRRSFSQAARDLALSQPSVSNQVAALEREIGTRLLERRPGGLRLTHAGEILLEHADAVAKRSRVRLADLSDDDWTAASTDGLIVRACRAAGFEPNLVSITHDQLAIRALIVRGLAVTLVPELLADPFKELALRPITGPGPGRNVYAMLPPGGRHPLVTPALDALHSIATELQVAGSA